MSIHAVADGRPTYVTAAGFFVSKDELARSQNSIIRRTLADIYIDHLRIPKFDQGFLIVVDI